MIARLVVLTLVLSAPGISSAIEVFEFEDALQQERFRNLAERQGAVGLQRRLIYLDGVAPFPIFRVVAGPGHEHIDRSVHDPSSGPIVADGQPWRRR